MGVLRTGRAVLVASALWAPVAGAAAQRPSTAVNAPTAPNERAAAAGARVYDAHKCATCHQIGGHGNARFPLDHVASKASIDDLRRWLTDADAMERALPRLPAVRMSEWLDANRKISAADIDALVAYLATLK